MRSPLGSEDSGVGCPLVVVGDAAQMASIPSVSFEHQLGKEAYVPDTRDMSICQTRSEWGCWGERIVRMSVYAEA
jgi:hypothetical protein